MTRQEFILWGWRSHLPQPEPIRITGGSKTHCERERQSNYSDKLGWVTGVFLKNEKPIWLKERILQIVEPETGLKIQSEKFERLSRLYVSNGHFFGLEFWRLIVWSNGTIAYEFQPSKKHQAKNGMRGWWPSEHYRDLMNKEKPEGVEMLNRFYEQHINKALGLPDPKNEFPLFSLTPN